MPRRREAPVADNIGIGNLVMFCELDAGVDIIPPIGRVFRPVESSLWSRDHAGDYTPKGGEIGLVLSSMTVSGSRHTYYEVLVAGKSLWFDGDCVFPLSWSDN